MPRITVISSSPAHGVLFSLSSLWNFVPLLLSVVAAFPFDSEAGRELCVGLVMSLPQVTCYIHFHC